jgi:hypothetical protein
MPRATAQIDRGHRVMLDQLIRSHDRLESNEGQ